MLFLKKYKKKILKTLRVVVLTFEVFLKEVFDVCVQTFEDWFLKKNPSVFVQAFEDSVSKALSMIWYWYSAKPLEDFL